jgi:sugar phosphate isomerase/epimerase
LKIGIDNYCLHPLNLDPMQTLTWAKVHGADGVQFSGLSPEIREKIDQEYLKDLAQYAAQSDLYLEWGGGQHIPYDTKTWKPRDILKINEQTAAEAATIGTRIVRSCSGGLFRWRSDSPITETLLQETAEALLRQRSMLRDHHVVLAVETHFEFTTFELRRLFEMCDAQPGDWLGICLDTMNLLTMLEDPVLATERILPWVVCTHFKDGSIRLADDGLTSIPTAIGKGTIDLKKIICRLRSLSRDVHLSIEDHGGSFGLPIFDPLFLSKFPDLTGQELARLIGLTQQTEEHLRSGKTTMTPREDWPAVCADRTQENIRALKKMETES